jgi:hypothetical protein
VTYGRRIHVSIKQPLGRTGFEQQVIMADVIFRHVPRGKPSLELGPNTTGIQLRQAF